MGTAVAAVTMAALTASQAPGLATSASAPDGPPQGPPISGDDSYYTDLPPVVTPDKPEASNNLPAAPGDESGTDLGRVTGGRGIPATVLAAYKKAEQELASTQPGCNLPWQLLAAIGQVESNQARGGDVHDDGTTVNPIRGPQLNGNGFAAILDTDNGAYDGDTAYDRAVGPMQFIPSTWAVWGTDANGDGKRDPNNVYDAAMSAGRYLCAGGRDLSVESHLDAAILGYNHSEAYLRTVKSWLEYFRSGTHQIPDNPGSPVPDPTLSTEPSAGDGKDKDKNTDGKGGKGTGGKGEGDKETPGGKPSGKPTPTPTTTGDGSVKPKPTPTKTGGGTVKPTPSATTPTPPWTPTSPAPSCPTPSDSASPSESASTLPEHNGSPTQASADPVAAASEKAAASSSSSSQSPDPCSSTPPGDDEDDAGDGAQQPSSGLLPAPKP
ncbi:hypothetical protein GCM10027168_41390 [Streptomyces capparidis]